MNNVVLWLQLATALLPVVMQTILAVEGIIGAGNGAAKKNLVVQMLSSAVAQTDTDQQHLVGIGTGLIDPLVASMNMTGQLKKAA